MQTMNLIGRVGRITKPYSVQTFTGENGIQRQVGSIYFTVAVERNYSQRQTDDQGNVTRRPATDWFLVKASGPVADNFNKYCTAVDANGKLVSRLIAITGEVETYQKERLVATDIPINGVVYHVENIPVNETNICINAEKIKYLDSSSRSGIQAQTAGAPVATQAAYPTIAPMVAPTVAPAPAPAVAQAPTIAPAPVAAPAVAPQVAPAASAAAAPQIGMNQPIPTTPVAGGNGAVSPW